MIMIIYINPICLYDSLTDKASRSLGLGGLYGLGRLGEFYRSYFCGYLVSKSKFKWMAIFHSAPAFLY